MLQCTGQPPQRRLILPEISVVLRFEEPALDKEELAGLLDELKVYCVKAYSIKRVITSLQ